MKKWMIFLPGLLLALVCNAQAYDDNDFQVWNTDVEEFKIDKNSKIALEQEFRWGDNASDFFYRHYDAGYFYKLNSNLQVGGGYRYIQSKVNNKFKPENEPYVSAALSGEFMKCAIDSRSRLEYMDYNYQSDAWRYRNKFTIKSPWKFTEMEIQPYLTEEIFIRFSGGGLNQNRLGGGLSLNFVKNVKAELYYMLVSSKSKGRWTDSNVLGTKLKVAF